MKETLESDVMDSQVNTHGGTGEVGPFTPDFTFTLEFTFALKFTFNLGGTLWGGGGNSKKVNTHPKIPEIDLDFFRLF